MPTDSIGYSRKLSLLKIDACQTELIVITVFAMSKRQTDVHSLNSIWSMVFCSSFEPDLTYRHLSIAHLIDFNIEQYQHN